MDFKPFLLVGLLLNSALYLTGVFVAGMMTHDGAAWKLALVAAGVSYLSYSMQIYGAGRNACATVVVISVLAGAAAGLLLLF